MYAAAAGKTDIPKKVAKKMIAETEKEDYEDMPEKMEKKKKRMVLKKKKKEEK